MMKKLLFVIALLPSFLFGQTEILPGIFTLDQRQELENEGLNDLMAVQGDVTVYFLEGDKVKAWPSTTLGETVPPRQVCQNWTLVSCYSKKCGVALEEYNYPDSAYTDEQEMSQGFYRPLGEYSLHKVFMKKELKPIKTFKIGGQLFEIWPEGSEMPTAARVEVGEMEYKGQRVRIFERLLNRQAN